MSVLLPPAEFLPTFNDIKNPHPFRYWVQHALPSVYDDALSYSELLQKVVAVLNEVIKAADVQDENISQMLEVYKKLQDYVNNYFSELDISDEVAAQIDNFFKSNDIYDILDAYFNTHIETVETALKNIIPGYADNLVNEYLQSQNVEEIIHSNTDNAVNNYLDTHDEVVEAGLKKVVPKFVDASVFEYLQPIVGEIVGEHVDGVLEEMIDNETAALVETLSDLRRQFNAAQENIGYLRKSVNYAQYGMMIVGSTFDTLTSSNTSLNLKKAMTQTGQILDPTKTYYTRNLATFTPKTGLVEGDLLSAMGFNDSATLYMDRWVVMSARSNGIIELFGAKYFFESVIPNNNASTPVIGILCLLNVAPKTYEIRKIITDIPNIYIDGVQTNI